MPGILNQNVSINMEQPTQEQFIQNLIELTQKDAILWKEKSMRHSTNLNGTPILLSHYSIWIRGIGDLKLGYKAQDLLYELWDVVVQRSEQARRGSNIFNKVFAATEELKKKLGH